MKRYTPYTRMAARLAAVAFAATMTVTAVAAPAPEAPPAAPQSPQAGDIERELADVRRQLDEAARRLAELHALKFVKPGKSDKAMLGILLGDNYDTQGIQLAGVTPGGGAEAAGMLAGDVIVGIGALSLVDGNDAMETLVSYMKSISPGETVPITYRRDGDERQTDVVTKAHVHHVKEFFNMPDIDIDLDELVGIGNFARDFVHIDHKPTNMMEVSGDLAAYFEVEKGVVLTSAAADSALKAGDVILAIEDTDIVKVTDVPTVVKSLHKAGAERAAVTFKRRGRTRSADVALDEIIGDGKQVTKVIRIKQGPDGDDGVRVEVID
ncbi:MAG: PDZ domain-containing protein [Pseudomonadota bacterium]